MLLRRPKPKPKPQPKVVPRMVSTMHLSNVKEIQRTNRNLPVPMPAKRVIASRQVSSVKRTVQPQSITGDIAPPPSRLSLRPKPNVRRPIFFDKDSCKPVATAVSTAKISKVKYQEIATPPVLRRLRQEHQAKIEFMKVNSAEGELESYLLDVDSPKADQPEQVLVPLMDHQRNSIAKMISLENKPFADERNTYYTGLLSDATGAGKSLAILSLICLNDLSNSDNLWLPCSNSKPNLNRGQFPCLDLNIVLVMPNILHQWQHYLDTQTNIKYGVISGNRVSQQELEKMAEQDIRVVLVNNELTVNLLALNLKVTRLIIDEIDLYIKTRKNKLGFSWILSSNIKLKCSFCWFLTATPEIMYNDKPQDHTQFHRFPYSCFASLPLSVLCNNLVVKNRLAYIENNLCLEKYSITTERCAVSNELSRCLQAIPECQAWAGRDRELLRQMIFCHNFQDLTKYFDEAGLLDGANIINDFSALYRVLTAKSAHKRVCKCDKKPGGVQDKNGKNKIETLISLLGDCGPKTLVFANDSKNICREYGDGKSWAIFDESQATQQLSHFTNGDIAALFLESMSSMRGCNMEMADNLIIFGDPGPENKIQIIGRAHRYGRKGPLRIYELRYSGE